MGREPFGSCEEDDESKSADNIRITHDMLIRSNAMINHPDLKGSSIADFHDLLEPKRQALLKGLQSLGQAEFGAEPNYHDDLADAALANLADLLAREILMLRLGLNAPPRVASHASEYEPLELAGLS